MQNYHSIENPLANRLIGPDIAVVWACLPHLLAAWNAGVLLLQTAIPAIYVILWSP